jgi:hypothetical protein
MGLSNSLNCPVEAMNAATDTARGCDSVREAVANMFVAVLRDFCPAV